MRTLSLLSVMFAVSAGALRLPPAGVARTRRADVRMQQAGDVNARLDSLVADNKVLLFMKGNKLFPQCGFSNTAVMILKSITEDFETFDVLADPEVREGIKTYSNWPTIPQCYIDGEFIGGCDLLIEMYQNGELQEMVEKSVAS